MFFLYLGASPPFTNVDMHYLFCRLSAEGFLEPLEKETLEDCMMNCSVMLSIWYNLVLYGSSLELDPHSWFSTKEFRVHSYWQHLCRREASKIRFLHVLQSCDDVEKDQRRLCAHFHNLFAFDKCMIQ